MPKDDNFLKDYYRESQELMRFRSGIEYRLLQFLLLFYPIIGVAMATLFKSSVDEDVFLWISVGATLFIILVTLFITIKIFAEHKNYHNVGQSVKKVWRYFQLHEVGVYLEKESVIPAELVDIDTDKGYGSGKGHIYTLIIIWVMALAMILLTVVLGIFYPVSEVNESLSACISSRLYNYI